MKPDRLTLTSLRGLRIGHGQHKPPNGKVEACVMEAAFLRWAIRQGWSKQQIVSSWTDSAPCICPVIGGFLRRWNDGIADGSEGDATRTRLFTPAIQDMIVGTRADDGVLLRRMWLAIDWDLRTRTPAFLRLAKLDACAVALEALPEIHSQADLADARAACEEARKQGDAAWAAAWAAAGAAALAAARAAARAAAGAAAGDAAGAAAGDAAGAALRPTVAAMQASALDLVKRMCAVSAESTKGKVTT
jgi:hypothetical protein